MQKIESDVAQILSSRIESVTIGCQGTGGDGALLMTLQTTANGELDPMVCRLCNNGRVRETMIPRRDLDA